MTKQLLFQNYVTYGIYTVYDKSDVEEKFLQFIGFYHNVGKVLWLSFLQE